MIELISVTKRYPAQKRDALQEINLTIETGEFFGLLGPNGAGKTTLIKILSTLLLPTSGMLRIDGERFERKRTDIKKKISLITQEFSLRSDMTPPEILELQGRLYRVPLRVIRERTDDLLEFCGLSEHRNKIVRSLSGGMKRKLMLCRALLTGPRILILDEPTVGLDPLSRRQMWDKLRLLNERDGITILLTTHYIDEAQALCRRVGLIDRGKLVRTESPKVLISELGKAAVDVFDGTGTTTHFFPDRNAAIEFVAERRRDRGDSAAANDGLDTDSEEDAFNIRASNLEDVFIRFAGSGLGEN